MVVETFKKVSRNDALAYFYCKYGESDRRDPESILRTVVKQLAIVNSDSCLPDSVVSLYRKHKNDGFKSGKLQVDESKDLIIRLTKEFQETFIVIDALDECDKRSRDRLLDALKSIMEETPHRVKVFVTSRDDDDIVLHLKGVPNVYIRSSDNSSDIETFIVAEIERCISKNKLLRGSVEPRLKQRIIWTLADKAQGM